MNKDLSESISYIQSKISVTPTIAVVLGSGLGDFAKHLKNPITIPTADIPNYPVSTVAGHAGKIIFGTLESNGRTSVQLVVFQGRVHLYESNDVKKVVFPIRVAAALGATKLIVTNAAGGINRQFDSGTLMFINDYLNLTSEDPLIGRKMSETSKVSDISQKDSYPNIPSPIRGGLPVRRVSSSGGGRSFSSLSEDLLQRAKSVAVKNGIVTKEGVYLWTKGPSYESASEIRMMGLMGADAVGMSTVPEIIMANHLGMDILGISCITNMGTGISLEKLSHTEVTETANRVKNDFEKLVSEIIFEMG